MSAEAHAATGLLRDRSGSQRVTNIELFFDLVYVFAVTQLSHYLLGETTFDGAFQTAILLAMVWLAWAYTTWVTNWLDPERLQVRLLLVVLMLISLAMSAELPHAFGDLGIWVGGAYALMQNGRTAFMVAVLPAGSLRRNYERIQVWCVVSGALAVGGGLVGGHARELLWLLAVGVDVLGGVTGFAVPWLGRSRTADWTIEGGHFAERCQAFILIALGESIVIIGATLYALKHVTVTSIGAFVVAFAGSVALWWLYFDRSADDSAEVIARSDDPGRLGRTAYHLIHPVMVAGIIVAAAGDEKVLGVAVVACGAVCVADPRRPGAVPSRARRLQVRDLEGHLVAPAGRRRGPRPARGGRPGAPRHRSGRLRGGGGGGRGRRRPPPPSGPGQSSSESLTTLMLSLASRNERSSRDLAIENSRYGTAACASPLSIPAARRSCGE